MAKTKKLRKGDILKIHLNDSFHAYARILDQLCIVVYNCKTKLELTLEEIIDEPVLFGMYTYIHKGDDISQWEIIGAKEIDYSKEFKDLFFFRPNLLKRGAYYKNHFTNTNEEKVSFNEVRNCFIKVMWPIPLIIEKAELNLSGKFMDNYIEQNERFLNPEIAVNNPLVKAFGEIMEAADNKDFNKMSKLISKNKIKEKVLKKIKKSGN